MPQDVEPEVGAPDVVPEVRTQGVSTGRLGSRFTRLWSAATLSNLADGVGVLALPLIAVNLTQSPVLVSGVRVAQTVPWFIFGLFAGVLTDRVDRRLLIIYGNLLRAAALAIIGVVAWLDGLSMSWLYVGAFVLGVAETFTDTASQAILPAVVETDQLRRANVRLYSAQVVMNEFVGSPLAGLLVGLATVAALITPAALYLVAGLIILALPGRYAAARAADSSILTDIRDGLAALWNESLLRWLMVFAAGSNLVNAAFFAVFVVYAVGENSPIGLTEFGYGLLLIAVAAGAIVGAQFTDRLAGKLRTAAVLMIAVIVLAACFALPAIVTNAYVVAIGLAFAGAAVAVANILTVSLRQELVPAHLLGRVTAGIRVVVFGTLPIGALLGGVVAEATSPRVLFLVLSGVVLLLAPVALRLRESRN